MGEKARKKYRKCSFSSQLVEGVCRCLIDSSFQAARVPEGLGKCKNSPKVRLNTQIITCPLQWPHVQENVHSAIGCLTNFCALVPFLFI